MKIRMKVPYRDDVVDLKAGSDGEGLTDHQKRRMVRVGLASEVKATTAKPERTAPKRKSAKPRRTAAKPAAPAPAETSPAFLGTPAREAGEAAE